MAREMGFTEWCGVISERIAKQREKEAEKKAAEAAAKAERLAKAQVQFAAWNVEKSVHDKALELLPELSPSRGSDESTWKEVALALCYVEIGLREKHKALHAEISANPKRSLEYMFMGWSRRNHSFDTVTISSGLAERFTKGTRMMFEDGGDGNFTIGGLGYVVNGRSPDGLVKPMSPDDKLRNGIFNGMCKKAWAACLEEASAALANDCGDIHGRGVSGDALVEIQAKREHACLGRGLYKIDNMVQDDKERAAAKIKSDKSSRVETGKAGHARWLERKDATRIKLPPEGTFKDIPKGSLNTGKYHSESFRVIKTEKVEPNNSATIVRRMGIGLKSGYAHATGEGLSTDMKLSRKALLKEGYVYLENFANEEGVIDDEAKARYYDELEKNEALRQKRIGFQEKRVKADHAFVEWIANKEGSELALECMQLLPVVLDFENRGSSGASSSSSSSGVGGAPGSAPGTPSRNSVNGGASVTGGGGSGSAGGMENTPLLQRAPTQDEYELWRAVGYACKAIDRALLTPWLAWSLSLFGKADCLREWGTFKPIAYSERATSSRGRKNNASDGEGDETFMSDEENGVASSPERERTSSKSRFEAMQRRRRASTHTDGKSMSPTRDGGHNNEVAGPASPSRIVGHIPLALYKPPKVARDEKWTPEDREAALRLLRMLSQEHRRLAALRAEAANEKPPTMPLLRREPAAEALPAFLHGHEGSVKRIQSDLAVADGVGIGMLGGTGVGSELVMQWFVGEDDINVGPALGLAGLMAANNNTSGNNSTAGTPQSKSKRNEEEEEDLGGHAASPSKGGPEGTEKLLQRLNSSATRGKPRQPPYVVVLETCGVAGSKTQRDGVWNRVLIDPPEPLPILSSAPGSQYVSISAKAQGFGILPPVPGEVNAAWEADSKKLRGCVRLTGLVPNTTYCYRVRAFSRAGASAYSFGAFTTAAAPPPAPILSLPFLAPRALLSVAAAPTGADADKEMIPVGVAPDSITLLWERRVDFRIHLLRLLRVFYMCISRRSGGGRRGSTRDSLENGATSGAGAAPRAMREDADGIREYVDEAADGYNSDDEAPSGSGNDQTDAAGGLFSYVKSSQTALVQAINRERGLYNWLASCVATPDTWPIKEGEEDEADAPDHHSEARSTLRPSLSGRFRIAKTRPATVLEVLLTDPRESFTWSDLISLFTDDAEADDPLDLMLAGTPLANGGSSSSSSTSSHHHSSHHAANDPLAGKPHFSLGGSGRLSQLSQVKSLLKRSHTLSKLNKPESDTTLARPVSAMTLSRSGGGGGGSGGGAASPSGNRPMSATSGHGASGGLAGSRRGSVAGSTIGGRNAGLKLNPAASDLGVRYSLLQCISDGPRGQEWSELYLGARSTRRIDKLLPGTSYTFKVQSINGDGQGSLFSPQAYVTTALPAPTGLRTVGRLHATTVMVSWDAVSAANALNTMRAISMGSSDTGTGDDTTSSSNGADGNSKVVKKADPGAGADIDAVLQALLKRTKTGAEEEKKKNQTNTDPTKKKKGFTAASISLVPVREGDGGVGLDLSRAWSKYDREASGVIDASCLRGLLADLGAFAETTEFVMGSASQGALLAAASVEGASSSGPAEWRLTAALGALDPQNTGRVVQQDFVDWWNSTDAAIEKALAVKSSSSSAGSRTRPSSARSSHAGGAGETAGGDGGGGAPQHHHGPGYVDPHVLGSPSAIVGKLTSAVTYVLECRRLLTKDEVELTQRAVVATGGFGATSSRPGSAATHSTTTRTALNAPTTAAGLPPISASSLEKALTPWSIIYMGPSTKFKVTDLLPNADYHFRVTAVGRHSFSLPSMTLAVSMPPLAPFGPVIVKTHPRAAVLRWYPGELSADKFEIQVKMLETILPQNSTVHRKTDRLFVGSSKLYTGRNISEATKRRLATSRALALGSGTTEEEIMAAGGGDENELWPEDPDGDNWVTLYTGTSTYTVITGLIGSAVYRVRAVAYNSRGIASRPSVETQLVTLDSAQTEPLNVANAGRHFLIECGAANAELSNTAMMTATGNNRGGSASSRTVVGPLAAQDVVVGDVVLFTEDVYVDSSPDIDPYHPTQRKEVPESSPRAHFLCSRTIAATVIGDSASHLVLGSGESANVGGINGPVHVGIAATAAAATDAAMAIVQSEETKTIMSGKTHRASFKAGQGTLRPRSSAGSHGGAGGSGIDTGHALPPPATMEEAVAQRALSLQIEWCTVSIARAGNYVLPHGALIKRKQADIAHLDMYRCMWEDETGRWSLGEELRASYDK